jgi:branched-chain amino acid transport system substrate-binding protein
MNLSTTRGLFSVLLLVAGALLPAAGATSSIAGERTIKIGVLGDQSGPYADLGGPGSVLAARLAVSDFGGKVAGKPVEVIAADMLNKPDVASSIARQWFDVDGVDAIADVPLTSVALAVQSVAREKKKVVLITGAASADLTGKACSPYSVHWMDDTTALSVGTVRGVVGSGGKEWFFLTPDYAFGAAMERAASGAIATTGGQVLGGVKFPLGTSDYSSYLLTAAASKATIFGLSTVGGETVNAVKQAAEFGLTRGDRKIVVFLAFLPEIHSIGLASAHGLYVTDGFYWDQSEQSRNWSKRYFEQMKTMPSKSQANTYAAVTHYLRAIAAVGGDDAESVSRKMKEMPADYFGEAARIRKNGRVMYDLTLYEVKSPAESRYPWDYYKPVRRIAAVDAFGSTEPGDCVPAR